MIFISHKGGFFHWGLIVAAVDNRQIAEQLLNFAKLYFNLELKIFLSTPKKSLDELSSEWQKIYATRAASFYLDEKIISTRELSPLVEKITDELKNSGRKLIEALSFTDEDFSVTLKIFREKLLVTKLHPEILSIFIAEIFESEWNLLPNPL